MTSSQNDSCETGNSLGCLQSDLTFQQIMTRNSNRFLIKELADLTGYHRNTTKKALSRLKDESKIKSIGTGNYTSYFAQTVTDHYRQIGKSLILIFNVTGEVDETVREKLRSFGYALVSTNLDEIVDDHYVKNYSHQTLREGLLHLKLSYPFTDIIQSDDGELYQNSVEMILDEKENKTFLTVKTCLCNGLEKNEPLCEMVAGALQAGIHIACQQLSSKIIHSECNPDDESCVYEILKNLETDEDVTAFDELM